MNDRSGDFKGQVSLSPEDAAEAARLLKLLIVEQGSGQSRPLEDPDPKVPCNRSRVRDLARRIRETRRVRSRFLSPSLTGEPGYDLLLTLYVAEGDGPPLTTKQAISASEVSQTTGLRWLEYLVDQDLVQKTTSPKDRRMVLIGLTDSARNLLDDYFTTIIDEGLAC